jgi:hypothetical protein
MVQEKQYRGEKACDKGQCNNNDDNNNNNNNNSECERQKYFI